MYNSASLTCSEMSRANVEIMHAFCSEERKPDIDMNRAQVARSTFFVESEIRRHILVDAYRLPFVLLILFCQYGFFQTMITRPAAFSACSNVPLYTSFRL
eukprot:GFKZ01002311.1.p1 GENE.GFKZ01002311.1~~GFKZ01002311.1.p1  ORF type:complete len:100 (+),score=7.26 GFKZ01002311.1:159-458(+)